MNEGEKLYALRFGRLLAYVGETLLLAYRNLNTIFFVPAGAAPFGLKFKIVCP
jgi:hypothetical protein